VSDVYKISLEMPKSRKDQLVFLQRTLGFNKLTQLLNFMLGLAFWAVNGVISGKQVCLYNPKTDEIEVARDNSLEALAKLSK